MRTIIATLVIAIAVATPVSADKSLSSLLRGKSNLTNDYRSLIRAPVPGSLKGVPRRPSPIETDDLGGLPAYYGSNGEYQQMARAAARRHNVPEDLFLRLVHQESRFRPSAKSTGTTGAQRAV